MELLGSNDIGKVSVDADQIDSLLRLLDVVVIKLEGGTEEDLKVLDAKPQPQFVIKETPPAPEKVDMKENLMNKLINELKEPM